MEYIELIEALDNIKKAYPKVYRTYVETEQEYLSAYAKVILGVYEQYASQALRDHASLSIIQNDPIYDKWQKAKYEYDLITNEQKIVQLQARLLMADDYSKSRTGEYGK